MHVGNANLQEFEVQFFADLSRSRAHPALVHVRGTTHFTEPSANKVWPLTDREVLLPSGRIMRKPFKLAMYAAGQTRGLTVKREIQPMLNATTMVTILSKVSRMTAIKK